MFLVSKCGPGVQRKTELWLEARDFYARTGLAREQVHFVRRRPDKGAVAARLRLDGSVDDRLDVLESLPATVRTRVLFGPQPASRPLPAGIVFAPTWTETLARLVARQESAPSRRKRPGAAR